MNDLVKKTNLTSRQEFLFDIESDGQIGVQFNSCLKRVMNCILTLIDGSKTRVKYNLSFTCIQTGDATMIINWQLFIF